eukprot:364730-Chlamydomonas_euryale.AAC.8
MIYGGHGIIVSSKPRYDLRAMPPRSRRSCTRKSLWRLLTAATQVAHCARAHLKSQQPVWKLHDIHMVHCFDGVALPLAVRAIAQLREVVLSLYSVEKQGRVLSGKPCANDSCMELVFTAQGGRQWCCLRKQEVVYKGKGRLSLRDNMRAPSWFTCLHYSRAGGHCNQRQHSHGSTVTLAASQRTALLAPTLRCSSDVGSELKKAYTCS